MIALPDGFAFSLAGGAVAMALGAMAALPFAVRLRPMARRLSIVWAPVAGMVLFAFGVFAVQAPLQRAIAAWIEGAVSPFWLGAHVWLLPAALALVASLVQEMARLGAVWFASARVRAPDAAVGALVGAGVGLFEAAMVLGAVPPQQLHILSVAVLERVGAVAFHTGAGAALGVGIGRGRAVSALSAVVALHWAIDGLAAMYGVGLVPLALAEAMSLAIGMGVWLWALGSAAGTGQQVAPRGAGRP